MGKPGVQGNWITYAVALYLGKDYSRALQVLHSFEKTLKEDKNQEKLKKHDKTELTLFEARCYEGAGDYKKAIEVLTRPGAVVANQTALGETLARLYRLSGDKDKAVEKWEDLLMLNSSNYRYYYEILKIHGFESGKGGFS